MFTTQCIVCSTLVYTPVRLRDTFDVHLWIVVLVEMNLKSTKKTTTRDDDLLTTQTTQPCEEPCPP